MATTDPRETPSAAFLEPLFFERACLTKVWGGRALEEVPGIELDRDGPVGETWELSDRPEHLSVVRGGTHAGRSLHELVRDHPRELLGETGLNATDRFPLLVKFLHAAVPLSVQVHPDDRTASRLHAVESGKDEAWYILAAEPDSLVYLGLRPEVDASAFAAVAANEDVVDVLQPWPIRAGEVVDVPAGTVHAVGGGVTLLEVQQASDLTYRLYDWGRVGLDGAPRETHVEEALLAIDYETPVRGPQQPELVDEEGGSRAARLVSRPSFDLALLEVESRLEADTGGHALIYVVVEGEARLELLEGESSWPLQCGDTVLVPAALGAHRLAAGEDPARLIVVTTKTRLDD